MLSFIIPAYNEERYLSATLHSVKNACESLSLEYEIVVADDDSSDATARIARDFGARVVSEHKRQIAATRNVGARAARGRRLIFVDADTLVSVPLVQATVAALDGGAAGGGCGLRFDRNQGRFVAGLFTWLGRLLNLGAGSYLYCTRNAFEACGGFDETLFAAEELAFSRAIRKHGRFVVLRESVVTSGRKLRAYTPRELLAALWGLVRKGPRALNSPDGLDIWYRRREEE